MVVHYLRTVWKNSDAEHEVTGKTYNQKTKKQQDLALQSLLSNKLRKVQLIILITFCKFHHVFLALHRGGLVTTATKSV